MARRTSSVRVPLGIIAVILSIFFALSVINYLQIEKNILSKQPKIAKMIAGLDFLNVYLTGPEIVDLTGIFPKAPQRTAQITEIIVHHSAIKTTVYNYSPLLEILKFHQSEGFGTIAYHFYISKSGIIYRLHPDRERAPHAKIENDKSIGICCEGDFNTEYLTGKQQLNLIKLIRDECDNYQLVPASAIKYHREVDISDCPGLLFMQKVELINQVMNFHYLKYLKQSILNE